MIVLDASALADVLLATPRGRTLEPLLRAAGRPHAPSVIDAEIVSALRAVERRRLAPPERVLAALTNLAGFRATRHPYRPLLPRAWQLRRNFTVYDALYVALAELAGAPFLTSDRRLARAVRRHTDVELAQA